MTRAPCPHVIDHSDVAPRHDHKIGNHLFTGRGIDQRNTRLRVFGDLVDEDVRPGMTDKMSVVDLAHACCCRYTDEDLLLDDSGICPFAPDALIEHPHQGLDAALFLLAL